MLGEEPVEQFRPAFEFRRVSRRLLVDQERAVGGHAAHEQGLLQPEQIHLGDKLLADDLSDDLHVRAVQIELFLGRCDPHDFVRARRKLLAHRFARAAQQHRLQVVAQLGQVFVAEHLALLVHDAVAVEEAKRRAQPAVIDELHDGVQLVEPVFQRRARQHEREPRAQPLDDAAGLRLPVLDALAFVQNDQIPLHAFDRQDVAQHLLVVADGEEAVVGVLLAARSRCRR